MCGRRVFGENRPTVSIPFYCLNLVLIIALILISSHAWKCKRSEITVILGGYNAIENVEAVGPGEAWAWGEAGLYRCLEGKWSKQEVPGEPRSRQKGSPPRSWVVDMESDDMGNLWLLSARNLNKKDRSYLCSIYHFRSTDGWEKQYETRRYYLCSISAYDAYHVWAIGNAGGHDNPDPLILFYDGVSWKRQTVPVEARNIYDGFPLPPLDKSLPEWDQSGVTSSLYQVLALDQTCAIALGDERNLVFNDGSWTEQVTGLDFGSRLWAVKGASATDRFHVWTPGPDGPLQGTDIDYGSWRLTFYDGQTWSQLPNAPYADSVYAADNSDIWVAGGLQDVSFGGCVYESSVGGRNGINWNLSLDETASADNSHSRVGSLDGYDRENIWGIGSEGDIFFFNGRRWEQQTQGSLESVSTDPDPFSRLEEPPKTVELNFTTNVEKVDRIIVERSGNNVVKGRPYFAYAQVRHDTAAVHIDGSRTGTYTVEYVVTFEDGTRESGSYVFYVDLDRE